MRQQTGMQLDADRLSIGLVRSEDIFPCKAVVGRTDDIEDLFVLVQNGLDFDIVEDELESRKRERRGDGR